MNSTTPYRPNWTYGSPAGKLSTYMGIARAAGARPGSLVRKHVSTF